MNFKLSEFIKLEGDGNGGSGGGASNDGGGDSGGAQGASGDASGAAQQGGDAGGSGGATGQGGSGAGGEDWRAGITDEHLRGAPALKDYTNIEALAKSHVELQTHLGNAVRVPGPDASAEDKQKFYQQLLEKAPGVMVKPDLDNPEQRDALYNQLGRPDKPESYKIPEIDTGDTKLDMSGAEFFREVAFNNGLSQAQFEAVVKDVTTSNLKAAQRRAITIGEGLQQLKGDWGMKFEDNIALATAVAERTGAPPELLAAVKANQATPATLIWLHDLASKLGGEGMNITLDPDNPNRDPNVLTPAEAKARISEMLNNKEHPLWNTHHPEHADAVKRRLELQKMASPDASTDDSPFIRTR